MAQVVIDCTPALHPVNGVGRVTAALLKNMVHQKGSLDFLLYTRSFRKKLSEYANCSSLRLRLPQIFEGLIDRYKLIEKMAPKADLFHATDHYMPIGNADRAIVTVHDLIFLKSPEAHLHKIHSEMARKVPVFIKKARHVITCSEYTKRDLQEYLQISEEKISVIPWGLNTQLFRPLEDKVKTRISLTQKLGVSNPYFLGVSCSTGRKNTLMLLDCYRELLKQHPQNDLVLVWDAPAEIRQKYAHPRIHFTGEVSDRTLRDLYACATATVYPTLYEGFGLPVLESMSCGTPVICSNVTSLPEVGGDVALYMNPLEPQSLSEQLRKFENNEVATEVLEKRGREHVKNFTWDKCARKTLAVYRRC